jgi:hypothetical protein
MYYVPFIVQRSKFRVIIVKMKIHVTYIIVQYLKLSGILKNLNYLLILKYIL